MADAIVVKDLRKTFRTKIKEPGLRGSVKSLFSPVYRETKAVDNISFTVKSGELVGFIGPNGAGKSTTLKILTGILFPTSGAASVLDITPWEQRKKLAYRIGTVFGQRSQLWLHLPAQDSFDLFAAIYNIPEEEYHKRLAVLVKQFSVAEYLDVPVRKLSLGERMRCELVAALLHKPDVLYLDEPSIGLDILAKKQLRDHILAINKQGVTVLLTSHDMDDIEEVCERVIIINHGKIVVDSSTEELRKKYLKRKLVTVHLAQRVKSFSVPGVDVKQHSAMSYEVSVDTTKRPIQSVLEHLTKRYDIADIEVSDPPIEEIIGRIYKR